jgi:amphi-Trp domain-containing protein
MSDVKLERKESISRQDAAEWLTLLAEAFAKGSHVELPFGPGSVSLHVPDQVRAEFEVEVERDEVELEVEFKWSTAQPAAAPIQAAETAPTPSSRQGNGVRGTTKSSRPRSR